MEYVAVASAQSWWVHCLYGLCIWRALNEKWNTVGHIEKSKLRGGATGVGQFTGGFWLLCSSLSLL